MRFGKKKETKTCGKTYDKENQKAVLRASICTGEQVAGFKDVHTGKFQDVMLVKSPADLEQFKEIYGVEEISKDY